MNDIRNLITSAIPCLPIEITMIENLVIPIRANYYLFKENPTDRFLVACRFKL